MCTCDAGDEYEGQVLCKLGEFNGGVSLLFASYLAPLRGRGAISADSAECPAILQIPYMPPLRRHPAMSLRILIWLLALAAGALPASAELPQPVAARLRAAGLPEDSMGVVVQRLSDGKVVLAHGAERAMQPA